MEDRLEELEQQIGDTESAIAECETSLQNFVNVEETQRLTQSLSDHRSHLQELLAEWETIGQALQT
jgi:hypothetical protein